MGEIDLVMLKIGGPVRAWLKKYLQERESFVSLDIFAEIKYHEMLQLVADETLFNGSRSVAHNFRALVSLDLLDILVSKKSFPALESEYVALRNIVGQMLFVDYRCIDCLDIKQQNFLELIHSRTYSEQLRQASSSCSELETQLFEMQKPHDHLRLQKVMSMWLKMQMDRASSHFRGVTFWLWKNKERPRGLASKVLTRKTARYDIEVQRVYLNKWKAIIYQRREECAHMLTDELSAEILQIRSNVQATTRQIELINVSIEDLQRDRSWKQELVEHVRCLESLYNYCEKSEKEQMKAINVCMPRLLLPASLAIDTVDRIRDRLLDSEIPHCQIESYPIQISTSANVVNESTESERMLLAWANMCLLGAECKTVASIMAFVIQPEKRIELMDAYASKCSTPNENAALALSQFRESTSIVDVEFFLFTLFVNDQTLWRKWSTIKDNAEAIADMNIKGNFDIEADTKKWGVRVKLKTRTDEVIDLHKNTRVAIQNMKLHLKTASRKIQEMKLTRTIAFGTLFGNMARNLNPNPLALAEITERRMPEYATYLRFLSPQKRLEIAVFMGNYECLLALLFLAYSDRMGSERLMSMSQLWWLCCDAKLKVFSKKVAEVHHTVTTNPKYHGLLKIKVSTGHLVFMAENPCATGKSLTSTTLLNRIKKKEASLKDKKVVVDRERFMNYGQYILAVASIGVQKFEGKCETVASIKNTIRHLERADLNNLKCISEFRKELSASEVYHEFERNHKIVHEAFKKNSNVYPGSKPMRTMHLKDLKAFAVHSGLLPKYLGNQVVVRSYKECTKQESGLGEIEFKECLFALSHYVVRNPYISADSRITCFMKTIMLPRTSPKMLRHQKMLRHKSQPVVRSKDKKGPNADNNTLIKAANSSEILMEDASELKSELRESQYEKVRRSGRQKIIMNAAVVAKLREQSLLGSPSKNSNEKMDQDLDDRARSIGKRIRYIHTTATS